MTNQLNQNESIFYQGKMCKFIKWETLAYDGTIKIKIGRKLIEVNISELKN